MGKRRGERDDKQPEHFSTANARRYRRPVDPLRRNRRLLGVYRERTEKFDVSGRSPFSARRKVRSAEAPEAGMAIEVISIEEKRPRPRVKRIRKAGEALKLIAAARKRRLIVRSILASLVLLVIAATIFFTYSYHYYAGVVDARLKSGYLTSRAGIYAAPRTLRAGQTLSLDRLVELLRRAGYLETSASDVWSGSFTTHDDFVEIHPRRATSASPDVVRVGFDKKGHISELTGDMGVTLESYALEPEILTTDAAMKTGKRAQLSYKEIPPTLAHAILSIEDRRFFEHGGVDIWGVGRAL